MDEQAAARMGDEIAHGFGLLAMVAGAVAGAIVGAAIIGATVATGGAALAVMTGAIAAGGLGLGQLVKGLTKVFNLPEPASGVLARGSPDIIIDYREAMRVGDLAVACSGLPINHFPLLAVPVAEGSATVFFNGKPAARVGNKMVCGAHIKSGSSTVVIGGPSVRTKFVWDVEQWTEWTLIGLGIFSLGVMGRAAWIKDGIVGVAKLAGFAGGGMLGFEGLGQLGDRLGPGYRDILQGVAGLALLGLGPKLAGKNSAGAAVSEDMQSAKNRPVLTEESSKPWYDMVLDSQKSTRPNDKVLQDEFGLPSGAQHEIRPLVQTSGEIDSEIRGVSGMGSPARGEVARRLTDSEIACVKQVWLELGGDPALLRINEGPFTGVSDRGVVYVRGDIFPTTSDSLHPTANLSVRETLAHEMGHFEYLDTRVAPRAWNDEFRASYWASKNVSGLSEVEQRNLVIDAIQRASDAGQQINMNTYIRSVVYGF